MKSRLTEDEGKRHESNQVLADGNKLRTGKEWRPVTRKVYPPFLVPGPNISKYLDPPDSLFQFC